MNTLADDQAKMRERMRLQRNEHRRKAALFGSAISQEALPIAEPVVTKPMAPARYKRGHVFYAINVLPRDGKRYKFGWTSCIKNRLEQHKIVAPDLLLVRTFPCHAKNESFVLACVRSYPQVSVVSGEVLDLHDPSEVIKRLKGLFAARDLLVPLP